MKLINAGITSKWELAERIKQGKKLYLQGILIHYDEEEGNTPFRMLNEEFTHWNHFKCVEIEAPFTPEVGKWYFSSGKNGMSLLVNLIHVYKVAHGSEYGVHDTKGRGHRVDTLEPIPKHILDNIGD